MTYNCLIVDDERPALKLLTAYLSKLPHLQLVQACENGVEAILALQQNDVDIMFLDIQMPDLTGLELLQTLKVKPQVIFTTAYREYAVEGFALDATDYLVKPFSFERFVQAVNKATELLLLKNKKTDPLHNMTITNSPQIDKSTLSSSESIFIKTTHKMEKVFFKDILYLESQREYVCIYTPGHRYLVHQSMNKMEEKLPDTIFLRIHRSYLIGLNHIETISGNTVTINNKIVPIGRSYRNSFFERIDIL